MAVCEHVPIADQRAQESCEIQVCSLTALVIAHGTLTLTFLR